MEKVPEHSHSTQVNELSCKTHGSQDTVEFGSSITASPADQARLVRKIDLYLLPLLLVSYGLQYLDKTSLSYGAILGIQKDLHLVSQQYSWSSSIFYAGYLVASYPICMGFVKFPLGKYLSVLIFLWGIVLTLHAVVHNFTGLMIVRFFLGVLESAISPGFSLITGMWYTPKEHVLRHCLWFAGNAIGSIIGSCISYGILYYKGPLAQWKILFVTFGLITVAWSVVLWFLLPDSPLNARFLNELERELASLRPKKFQHTTQTKNFNWSQAAEVLKDFQAWWFLLFSFVISVPNGGTTSFSTLIIKSFGYDARHTILMGLPASAFQLFAVFISALATTNIRKSRIVTMILIFLMGMAGILMIKLSPTKEKLTRLAGFWLVTAIAPIFPLMLSLAASNIAGFTKKSMVLGMVFLGYCGGNWAGPQFFITKEAPGYHTAYTTIIICYAIALVMLVLLRAYLMIQNSRRNKEQGVQINPEEVRTVGQEDENTLQHIDETDKQNRGFRYIL